MAKNFGILPMMLPDRSVSLVHAAYRLVDDLILATDGARTLYLIDPDPQEYKQLASAELLGESGGGGRGGFGGRMGTQNWAPLALSEGKLLIRDQSEMKCVKVAQ